jgi:hypothetical protein
MIEAFAVRGEIYKIKLCLFDSAIEMRVTKIWKLLSGISSMATYSKKSALLDPALRLVVTGREFI